MFNESEKKVLRRVRRDTLSNFRKYMFCFIYDGQGIAVTWEGGYNLPLENQFRNQYTIEQSKRAVKNW